jgi:hypothetical protein
VIGAVAYLWLGALDSPLNALLFSVDSMSTRGASGLTLQRHWQLMGALEAVNGMLVFGVSTAYLFTLGQVYISRRTAMPDEPVGRARKINKGYDETCPPRLACELLRSHNSKSAELFRRRIKQKHHRLHDHAVSAQHLHDRRGHGGLYRGR